MWMWSSGCGAALRAAGGTALDAYTLDFHRRVRQGYHQLAQAEPQRWVIIDAVQAPERVQEAMRQVVLQRL